MMGGTVPDGDLPDMGGNGTAAAIGNVAVGLVDSFVDARTAKKNTEKTIAAQKAEAELAYQRSIEMWHMQNAYNSPAEQMKRFGAAGLNPHLIYGQGSAGNASNTPNYQAPNLQYRYAAPAYGAALGSAIPTLMAVGTWMQNMRLSEVEIENKKSNVEKTEQLIEFLRGKFPREIQRLDNALSLYPYQKSLTDFNSQRAAWTVNDLIRAYEYKYGSDRLGFQVPAGGTAKLDYLRKLSETRLKQAQASWTDFNVTNPQALIQMVLGGVMGMAGQQLRLSTHKSSRFVPKKVTTRFDSRGRRIYQRAE